MDKEVYMEQDSVKEKCESTLEQKFEELEKRTEEARILAFNRGYKTGMLDALREVIVTALGNCDHD